MRKVSAFIILGLAMTGLIGSSGLARAANAERKIVSRTEPSYPALAIRMHIQGIVKLEAVVRPNGTVKSTRVIGGNPVLVDAATAAVGKWKFEAGPNETTEIVQVTFVEQ
jgi:TonB family protein